MPRIKITNQTISPGGPVDTARARPTFPGEGLQSVASNLMGLGDALAQRKAQAETTDVAAKLAKFQADNTIAWQEQLRTADPSDTELSKRFLEQTKDQLDKLGEGVETFSAKQYLQREAAQMAGGFAVQAVQGQADLAAKKAVADYDTVSGSLQSATLNNPSSFVQQLKFHEGVLQEMVKNGNLPSVHAQQLRQKTETELAQAAIRGWTKLNPKDAKAQLDSGTWDAYLKGDTKKQAYGEILQQEHANLADLEAKRKEAERLQKIAQEKTQNEFLAKMNEGKLSSQDILASNLEAFGSGSKNQFITMLSKGANDPLQKTDPALFISLWDRVHLPDGNPNKIVDENVLNEYAGRGLKITDIQHLRDEIQGKRTIEGQNEDVLKRNLYNIAKGKLTKSNPMLGIQDPEGDEQYQKFLSAFTQDYKKSKEGGKNYRELLDPNSKDYMGKNVYQYTRTPEQIINSIVKGMAPPKKTEDAPASPSPAPSPSGKPPRNPGETPAEYLKRIGN